MNRENMAKELTRLRQELNLTQKQVADAVGISESAYSQYETGAKVPRDDTKVALAKFYNRSIMSIFFSDCTH